MPHKQNPRSHRVIVYVDGFNLYHGMHHLAGRRYLWLDLEALMRQLLKTGQRLEAIRYFTAPVRDDPAALARQKVYLRALSACTSIEIVLGRFQEKHAQCRTCSARWSTYEEKETDVSLAVSLVEDAVADRFDTALLVSADSDFCSAVRVVNRLRASARVVAVFPPRRRSDALRRACSGVFYLSEARIRGSQLPDAVPGPNGAVYRRPKYWS